MTEAVPAAPSARSVFGTLALVVASIAALLAVDTFLATLERSARRSEAAGLFEEGRRLAAAGHPRDAVERYRSAASIDRANRPYRLELARAQLAAGRLRGADSSLVRLLQEDGTDGEANLMLARVLVREGRKREATAYYHRAIYGIWTGDGEDRRTSARLELIDLLAGLGARRELLAELLPLEGIGVPDSGLRRRLAHLFVQAGAPERAVVIFRELLAGNGRDADSYAGLGEAEFALGRYRPAAADLRAALRLEPADSEIARQLDLVTRVRALDPMLRGLGAGERERRARELLRLALDAAARCPGAGDADSVRTALDSAGAMPDSEPRTPGGETLETNLELAERIRASQKGHCSTAATVSEQALDLVLAKVAE